MDYKKLCGYLIGVIFTMLIAFFIYIWVNRESSTETVKVNGQKIQVKESEKKAILEAVAKDSIYLDSINKVDYKKSHDSILNNIKQIQKDEKINVTDYVNADDDKRVGIFAELAGEKSSYKRK